MNNIPFMYKYKPYLFKDFEIDSDIIDILNTMISMNNLNILFIGDSGSGKTSLIHAIIKEYYGNNQYNDNILVINSLKEQGIQYYRTEVKTFCQTRCSIHGKKKIVVLDDIDNINEQSQQVFRNCIDKYNNNVHFISSCSNVQKVIDSLQSRMIIIKLKPLTETNLNNILQKIKVLENIVVDKKTEKFVLTVANGSIRILLNYLEKFKILDEPVTYDLVNKVCTNISFSIFHTYSSYALTSNLNDAIHVLYDLFDKGYSVMDIYDNYFLFVKITDLFSETQKYEIIKLLCKYITVFHNIHEDEIELALFTNNIIQVLSK
jgi:DNA polymerase III delta prime subunit